MADQVPGGERKPWIVPAVTGALEPDDIANSYLTSQDSNPHSSNNADAS